MNRGQIIDAYVFLRKNNHSIPDDVLDFMKDSSLRAYDAMNDGECSSCAFDGLQSRVGTPCTGCCAEGNYKHFKKKAV